MRSTFFLLAVLLSPTAVLAQNADKKPTVLKQRASVIDPRTKEDPGIDFLFTDKAGKVLDTQTAMVDMHVKPQGKLMIWLMGYSAPLFERVSGYGYHCIQVHYANQWFAKIPKERNVDGESLGKMRLEAATGEDHTPLAKLSPPDGMMERAFQFVKWLAKEHPAGKWEQFLSQDGKGLDWEKVTVAGSSHGATTAARFGVYKKVGRVVMLCGPRDQTENWQALPSATPAERYFGFSHTLDGGWTGNHYCRSWQMLGLQKFGPIVDVDKTPAPFGNSRRLTTSFDVKGDSKRAHSSVQPGGAAFKNEKGQYMHEAVWKYLFTHPVDSVGEAVATDPACKVDPKK